MNQTLNLEENAGAAVPCINLTIVSQFIPGSANNPHNFVIKYLIDAV